MSVKKLHRLANTMPKIISITAKTKKIDLAINKYSMNNEPIMNEYLPNNERIINK